jgi:hypothetical protein
MIRHMPPAQPGNTELTMAAILGGGRDFQGGSPTMTTTTVFDVLASGDCQ